MPQCPQAERDHTLHLNMLQDITLKQCQNALPSLHHRHPLQGSPILHLELLSPVLEQEAIIHPLDHPTLV
jgi:DNA-directed RNA polymerase subunit L